ncbi:hypothetical protein ACQP3F_33965, partial [Escherichia coli]
FPQSSAPRTASRLLAEMIQPHRPFQPIFNYYLYFLKDPPKIPAPPDNRKKFRENNTHIPKGWIMDVCHH